MNEKEVKASPTNYSFNPNQFLSGLQNASFKTTQQKDFKWSESLLSNPEEHKQGALQ